MDDVGFEKRRYAPGDRETRFIEVPQQNRMIRNKGERIRHIVHCGGNKTTTTKKTTERIIFLILAGNSFGFLYVRRRSAFIWSAGEGRVYVRMRCAYKIMPFSTLNCSACRETYNLYAHGTGNDYCKT